MNCKKQKTDNNIILTEARKSKNTQSVQPIIPIVTIPNITDAVTKIADKNEGASLIIASAIGTSIILYVITKCVAKLIDVFRSGK